MRQSYVIEIAGAFAGAAVTHSGKYRFIAVDPRVGELDGSLWQTLPDMRRMVAQVLNSRKFTCTTPIRC